MLAPVWASRKIQFLMIALSGLLFSQAVSRSTSAAEPQIQFDTPRTCECTLVEGEDPSAERSHKTICIKLPISTITNSVDLKDVELFYQIYAPSQRMMLIDHDPKTELGSEYAGNIIHDQTKERINGVLADAGVPIDKLSLGAHLNLQNKNTDSIHYEKLSPKFAVTASGSIARGAGVYYKIRGNDQISLEGTRTFVAAFRVPQNWKSDVLQIHCRATQKNSTLFNGAKVDFVGRSDFLVAVYESGSDHAQQLASEFSKAEDELKTLAKKYQSQIKYTAKVKQNIPGNWLGTVLFEQSASGKFPFISELPQPIRIAIADYANAKRQCMQQEEPSLAHK